VLLSIVLTLLIVLASINYFSLKDGFYVTVLAFYVTWSRALARAGIGGVERQNPSICRNRSFVNNLFFP
jgi:hypothetical protein